MAVFMQVLLRSELIKSSSEERSLLKNLGSWLGKLTIGRNQALRAREVDPKALITEVGAATAFFSQPSIDNNVFTLLGNHVFHLSQLQCESSG